MARDQSHFLDLTALLKQPADAFMAQVVKVQIQNARLSDDTSKGHADGLGFIGEDKFAGAGLRRCLKKYRAAARSLPIFFLGSFLSRIRMVRFFSSKSLHCRRVISLRRMVVSTAKRTRSAIGICLKCSVALAPARIKPSSDSCNLSSRSTEPLIMPFSFKYSLANEYWAISTSNWANNLASFNTQPK